MGQRRKWGLMGGNWLLPFRDEGRCWYRILNVNTIIIKDIGICDEDFSYSLFGPTRCLSDVAAG